MQPMLEEMRALLQTQREHYERKLARDERRAANPAPHASVKPMQGVVRRFSGHYTPGEAVYLPHTFCRDIQLAASRCSDQQKIKIAVEHMEGEAMDKVRDDPTCQECDWEEFKAWLKESFTPSGRDLHMLKQNYTPYRRRGEDFISFANRIIKELADFDTPLSKLSM
ncbi:MAG: hypothetical protein AAGM46_27400 [Cyanobacteria bacterium J06582_2]